VASRRLATQAEPSARSMAERTAITSAREAWANEVLLSFHGSRRPTWSSPCAKRKQGDAPAALFEAEGQDQRMGFTPGPESRFERCRGFAAPPRAKARNDSFANHWHVAFIAATPTAAAEQAIASHVGGTDSDPEMEREGGARTVADSCGRDGTHRMQLPSDRDAVA
jgi:hypothetical protein